MEKTGMPLPTRKTLHDRMNKMINDRKKFVRAWKDQSGVEPENSDP